MAHLLVNKALVDKTGLVIPTASIIGFTPSFVWGEQKIAYSLACYKTLSDFEAGKEQILPVACEPFGFYKIMSNEELASLETEAGAITKVCQWLKDQLVLTGNFIDADLTIVLG